MKPPPLDYTHGRTTLGVACHHRLFTAHMVERHRARHAITTFRQLTRSNHVGHGMPSLRLGSTHSPTTSGMECHHHLWAAQTVERHRAWHDIIALGLHARSDDVGRGMTSTPLDSTHGRTTSSVACHHRVWAPHTIKRRRAWHGIIIFGQHKRSNDVGRGMPSSPLGSTNDRTTRGVALNHCPWTAQTVKQRQVWHDITAL